MKIKTKSHFTNNTIEWHLRFNEFRIIHLLLSNRYENCGQKMKIRFFFDEINTSIKLTLIQLVKRRTLSQLIYAFSAT